MRRRGIRSGKKYGTPTVNPPVPQGIDDYTGFKVPLASLRKDWQGLLTQTPDRRNPQDYLRGVPDRQALPYSRPQLPAEFVAAAIVWQDGTTFITPQNGLGVLLTQGIDPGETL